MRRIFLFFGFFLQITLGDEQCARYEEACGEDQRKMCCGYPLFDCITDGALKSCQPINEYPELYAEILLRVREAVDRGGNGETVGQLQKDINSLLQNRPPASSSGGSGGSRSSPTRSARRRTTRRGSGGSGGRGRGRRQRSSTRRPGSRTRRSNRSNN